jgi:DNA mismatch repair protein MSH3
MAAAKRPQKKQASLTSFFTPSQPPPSAQRSSSPAPPPSASESEDDDPVVRRQQKRPLAEDFAHGNTLPERSNKRVRSDETKSAFFKHPSSDERIAPAEPASEATALPSSRTRRYTYQAESKGASAELDEEPDDEATRKRKEDTHKKFVKKLAHPEAMTRWGRRNLLADAMPAAEGDDEDGDDAADGVEEDEAPAQTKAGRKKGAKTGKLTPMELQMLEIKRKHMDTLLIVEVGYKFRFFGEDARTAARELGIVCIPGKFRYDEHQSEAHLDRFASASIPVHRLSVHARRLVAAGHKVGVVRQIETAALKKAGDNRNTPFIRKLTQVYTKGTYVDEIGELDQMEGSGAPAGGYLLCITESVVKGTGTDERVDVGVIAVQPATGDIIYDSFEDGFMRSEIETRLLHISPCEFLIVGELTKATDKLLQHLSGSASNVFGDRSRVETVPRSKTMAAEAYSHVTQFYAGKLKDGGAQRSMELLDKVLHLPEQVTICLSAMITHLTEYHLEHIFDLTKYFQPFGTRQHMLISGTSLESLEVYRNSTDHTEKASLLWALDKTRTRFGGRLLRKWIGRPLLDEVRLAERLAAVEELLDAKQTPKGEKLEALLKSTRTDIERSLIRIYYGKCTRPELLSVLQTLQKISLEYSRVRSAADTGFRSTVLAEAILALPAISDIVVPFLDKINPEAARKDDKYSFFRESDESDEITNHKMGIAAVEQDLDDHRKDAAEKLSRKSPVAYATVAGVEYLIEVPREDLKHVPASWIKENGTKKVSRFHTPEVKQLMAERDQHKEALAAACDTAFSALLTDISAHYQPLRDAVSSLATLDCLVSLSIIAALPGYSRPKFLPSNAPPSISITEGRHPIAEHTLATGYIPFTSSLSSPAPLAYLITGPNMGGKSSFVRAVALLVLMAQIGSYVPAAAMTLTLHDAIHTRMGARDNLFAGESTFMVEVSETAAILKSATPRSLVVLDELGRGTSTHDGAAIAQAVLEHVVRETQCLTLFITHYQSLARVADGIGGGRVRNVHMRFTANKPGTTRKSLAREESRGGETPGADEADDEEITFLYEVAEGVAHRSYGLNVARLARIPKSVIDVAAAKSRELEDEMKKRRLNSTARLMNDVLQHGTAQLDSLISSIEQL